MLYNVLLQIAFSYVHRSTNGTASAFAQNVLDVLSSAVVRVVKPRTFVVFGQQWGTFDQSAASAFFCVLYMVFTGS